MIHSQFSFILLFVIAGLLFISAVLIISKLLRSDKPSEQKLTSYESGEETTGDAIVGFRSRYYIVALIFILFEAELVLLFPWSTVFGNKELIVETQGTWGWFSIFEMFIFIGVLAIGLVYVWAQGHLDWVKPNLEIKKEKEIVPQELYDKINEKYA